MRHDRHVGRVKAETLGRLRPQYPLTRVYTIPAGHRATSESQGLWWADPDGIKLSTFDRHDAEHYGIVVPEDAIEHSAATCWCMRRSE